MTTIILILSAIITLALGELYLMIYLRRLDREFDKCYECMKLISEELKRQAARTNLQPPINPQESSR